MSKSPALSCTVGHEGKDSTAVPTLWSRQEEGGAEDHSEWCSVALKNQDQQHCHKHTQNLESWLKVKSFCYVVMLLGN